IVASDQPGCCGVAAKLPKKPGTQKLTPPSSANALWEKNMIAGAKTIAATPSLRRRAEIGRPLFAAVSAMLAVILCPVASILAVSALPSNKLLRVRNLTPREGGTHYANSARIEFARKKDEYCDQRATGAIAGISPGDDLSRRRFRCHSG